VGGGLRGQGLKVGWERVGSGDLFMCTRAG
jgi:hypothetical protein